MKKEIEVRAWRALADTDGLSFNWHSSALRLFKCNLSVSAGPWLGGLRFKVFHIIIVFPYMCPMRNKGCYPEATNTSKRTPPAILFAKQTNKMYCRHVAI